MTNNDFVLVNIPETFAGKTILEALGFLGFVIDAPCGGSGRCGNCTVLVKTGENFIERKSCRELVKPGGEIVKLKPGTFTQKQNDNEITNGEKKREAKLAVDIGTTTIEAVAITEDGNEEFYAILNPQKIHGADVISRIEFANKSEENLKLLSQEVNEAVSKISAKYDIKSITCCGNPTMISLLLGISPEKIGVSPYEADDIQVFAEGKTIIPGAKKQPGSGFLGGDAVATACEVELCEGEMVIDLGTNGELVLKSNGKYYGTSTAAGPCFEGANISSGIGGVAGAVSSVTKTNGAVSFSTIKNAKPIGICGAGIIDIVAMLLKDGTVSKDGHMAEDYELVGIKDGFRVDTGLSITPLDIRNVQMAKSAIYTSIEMLAEKAGIGLNQINRLYVAGGLGRYINIANALDIGLFPRELENKIVAKGNCALKFAVKLAKNEREIVKAIEIAENINIVSLSEDGSFQQKYLKNMFF